MAEAETRTCTSCGFEVAAVPAGTECPGYKGWAIGLPLRRIIEARYALLHHRCRNPQLSYLVERRNWFACERPESPVDADTLFDAYCLSCEARWVAEGAEFWNGPTLSDGAAQVMLEEAEGWAATGMYMNARAACERVIATNAQLADRANELLRQMTDT
jgi:hypothetical protein